MSNSRPASSKQPGKNAGDGAEGKEAVRLADALRDNLRRRKAQQRARDESGGGPQRKPGREGKG